MGVTAGLVGTAVMTAFEEVEQRATGRPRSFVPAHTIERLLRLPHRPGDERRVDQTLENATGVVADRLVGWAPTRRDLS